MPVNNDGCTLGGWCCMAGNTWVLSMICRVNRWVAMGRLSVRSSQWVAVGFEKWQRRELCSPEACATPDCCAPIVNVPAAWNSHVCSCCMCVLNVVQSSTTSALSIET